MKKIIITIAIISTLIGCRKEEINYADKPWCFQYTRSWIIYDNQGGIYKQGKSYEDTCNLTEAQWQSHYNSATGYKSQGGYTTNQSFYDIVQY